MARNNKKFKNKNKRLQNTYVIQPQQGRPTNVGNNPLNMNGNGKAMKNVTNSVKPLYQFSSVQYTGTNINGVFDIMNTDIGYSIIHVGEKLFGIIDESKNVIIDIIDIKFINEDNKYLKMIPESEYKKVVTALKRNAATKRDVDSIFDDILKKHYGISSGKNEIRYTTNNTVSTVTLESDGCITYKDGEKFFLYKNNDIRNVTRMRMYLDGIPESFIVRAIA